MYICIHVFDTYINSASMWYVTAGGTKLQGVTIIPSIYIERGKRERERKENERKERERGKRENERKERGDIERKDREES